jgi:hypothetical protein
MTIARILFRKLCLWDADACHRHEGKTRESTAGRAGGGEGPTG